MPSITSRPSDVEVMSWYLQKSPEELGLLREPGDSCAWEYTVRCALVAWEREGKPRLPITDPRSLA